MTRVEVLFLATYFLVLLILSVYGSHRYVMAYLFYKYKGNLPAPKGKFERLPRVTIQLPVFNEMYVVERLIAIGAFVTSQIVFIKELGVGTALAATASGP